MVPTDESTAHTSFSIFAGLTALLVLRNFQSESGSDVDPKENKPQSANTFPKKKNISQTKKNSQKKKIAKKTRTKSVGRSSS